MQIQIDKNKVKWDKKIRTQTHSNNGLSRGWMTDLVEGLGELNDGVESAQGSKHFKEFSFSLIYSFGFCILSMPNREFISKEWGFGSNLDLQNHFKFQNLDLQNCFRSSKLLHVVPQRSPSMPPVASTDGYGDKEELMKLEKRKFSIIKNWNVLKKNLVKQVSLL